VNGYEIANAEARKPGSLRLLNAHRAIARLIEAAECSSAAPATSAVADLPDDDVAELLLGQLEDLIASRPEIVVEAAESLGFVIVRYPDWVASKE
jgi:hypothetical protein